jgi:hypothetical protein
MITVKNILFLLSLLVFIQADGEQNASGEIPDDT